MHVLVDLDGTLLDPKPGILGSIQYALARLGAPVPPLEDLTWAIGPPLRTTFPQLLGCADLVEEAVALYREKYVGGAMYDALVYAGIPQALEALSAAGCRLILATAKPHVYARPILNHFDLGRHFAAVYGPELDGTNDSKADLIACILREHRVSPQHAIMVGDRHIDISAAAHNEIGALGVTWGYGSRDELITAGAAGLCVSPGDLARTALELLQQRSALRAVQLSHAS
jgi:phosphoglycolate phosphatase